MWKTWVTPSTWLSFRLLATAFSSVRSRRTLIILSPWRDGVEQQLVNKAADGDDRTPLCCW